MRWRPVECGGLRSRDVVMEAVEKWCKAEGAEGGARKCKEMEGFMARSRKVQGGGRK